MRVRMQTAAILVLTWACTTNTQNIPPLPGRSNNLNNYWPSPPSNQGQTTSDQAWTNDPNFPIFLNPSEQLNEEPPKSLSSKPQPSWLTDSAFSEQDYDPQEFDFLNQKSFQISPQIWSAPPYSQSMKDYDDAIAHLKNHFTSEGFTDTDHKNFRYIVMAHVIDKLSKSVAEEGWEPYEQNYTNLLRNYIEQAVTDPRGVVSQLMCSMIDPATRKLQRVKNIIYSPTVEFVCKVQPSACDTVIYAIIKSNYNIELENSANVLLSLGRAASNFLKNYAPALDAISTQNAYLYLLKSGDSLRELVGRNAEARKLIFPNGSRLCFQ